MAWYNMMELLVAVWNGVANYGDGLIVVGSSVISGEWCWYWWCGLKKPI